MTMKPKYDTLLQNEKLRRWYENSRAKSVLTASVYLRCLGYYCELEKTTPDKVINEIEGSEFRDGFMDFVRSMERQGKRDHT